MVYRSHWQQRHELEYERFKFVREILDFIIADEPYVFFDEMSVHSFMHTKKAWSYRDQPVVAVVNSGRRYSQTVYGAIGNIF